MKKILCMLAAIFFTLTTLTLFQLSERNAFAASGQSLFNKKCSSCHTSPSQFKGWSFTKFKKKAKNMPPSGKKLTAKQLKSVWNYVK